MVSTVRALFSYHYYKNVDIRAFHEKVSPVKAELFIDSGAFSAHTQGVKIDLKEYVKFLQNNREFISVMATLDDLSSPQKTRENHLALISEGLPVIPCFHVGEPLQYLEQYLEEHDYVALGGMVPYMRSKKDSVMRWLVQCFRLAQKFPGRGFHGFGCTAWKVVASFPWRSVDSSSWGAGFRFGSVPVFDVVTGSWHEVTLGDPKNKKLEQLIKRYGFRWQEFTDRSVNTRRANAGLAMASWLEAEKWLSQRHGGARVYFVDGNTPSVKKPAGDIGLALEALK